MPATAGASDEAATRSDGVIFVNPASGPEDDTAERLSEHFPGSEIEEVDGEELTDAIRSAADAGAGFVGMAGGDGSIRCAAGLVADTEVALLPIPAGTKNHFAKAVGLPTFEDAAEALRTRRTRQVDLGEVNGECFVNNASVGLYPMIVRNRRSLEDKLPKQLATMVAAWPQIKELTRFPVAVGDGELSPAWMVFIGNGCYGTNVFQAADRERLDEGQLDLRICHADAPLSRLRAAGALLAGRLDRSPMVTRRTGRSFRLSTTGTIDVAVDGEVMRMESPLEMRSRPGALRVFCGGSA